jgi:transposase
VELFSGECFFQAQKEARTEQIVAYFLELAAYLQSQGYQQVHFYLDNNTTHLAKRQALFQQQSQMSGWAVDFHYFPKYSPKLNVVEYLIHLIRQKWLHHSDYKQRLEIIEQKLAEHLPRSVFIPKENIANILQHIQELVMKT